MRMKEIIPLLIENIFFPTKVKVWDYVMIKPYLLKSEIIKNWRRFSYISNSSLWIVFKVYLETGDKNGFIIQEREYAIFTKTIYKEFLMVAPKQKFINKFISKWK